MRGWTSTIAARGTALLALAAAGTIGSVALAQQRAAGYAWDDPDWRFTQRDRRVKVVLLAGSIGAFRDQPYGRLLYEWCANAEIRNLSQVGQGAPQLLQRFREQVIENENVPIGAPNLEMWVLFGGGLNSVSSPHRTNRSIAQLIRLAHRRRIGVVALTLTPWGSREDRERWSGARGLHVLRSTRAVVDFVMGRSSPAEALGPYARERRGVEPDAPWLESEQPDVAIDLYDSPLRDRDAEPWPLEEVRAELVRDPAWIRSVAGLDPVQREARLDADARTLAEAPRWFLRPEYRGFDHIHPNRAGHRVIAETVCPHLPASWGCQCPRR
ncbi:MAG TPA: hypothetical protein VIL20_30730 [Sandaracinaceae bacterium]